MRETSVQEERSEKSPVFSLSDNGIRIQCASSMQNFRIVEIANGNLEKECDYIEQNQHENCWCASELARALSPLCSRDGFGSSWALVRSQMLKQSNLITQLGSWMQNLKDCSQFSSRSVVAPCGEFRHFA